MEIIVTMVPYRKIVHQTVNCTFTALTVQHVARGALSAEQHAVQDVAKGALSAVQGAKGGS
eukprot:scaffold87923_cov23-Tisochrysis_lutea.AAC.1